MEKMELSEALKANASVLEGHDGFEKTFVLVTVHSVD